MPRTTAKILPPSGRSGSELAELPVTDDWWRHLALNLNGRRGHFLLLLGEEQQLVPFGSSFLTTLQVVRALLDGQVTTWWRYSLAQGLTNLVGDPVPWQQRGLGVASSDSSLSNYADEQTRLRWFLTTTLRRPAIYTGQLVLVLNNLSLLVPDRGQAHQPQEAAWLETFLFWSGQDERIARSGNLILSWVARREDVPPRLRACQGGLVWQEFPQPDQNARASFILWRQQVRCCHGGWSLSEAGELARQADGLGLQELGRILLPSADQADDQVDGQTGDHMRCQDWSQTQLRVPHQVGSLPQACSLTRPTLVSADRDDRQVIGHVSRQLQEQRREHLLAEAGDVLTVIEPSLPLKALGGLSLVRPYLLAVLRRFCAGKGVGSLLFMGPPGTGKTAVAAALAAETKLLCLAPLNIRERWVGASERNLERLLVACLKFAPLVLFLDEIDLNLGKRMGDNDSGVNNRLFQRLLTLLSDPQTSRKVLVIAATNWPNLLDRALIRAGRFQAKLPFFLPTAAERVEILQRQLQVRLPSGRFATKLLQGLADSSPLTYASGADLAALVNAAQERAEQLGENLNYQHLEWALQELILTHDQASLELMTLLAVQHTTHRSFLPPLYHHWLEDGALTATIQRLQQALAASGRVP